MCTGAHAQVEPQSTFTNFKFDSLNVDGPEAWSVTQWHGASEATQLRARSVETAAAAAAAPGHWQCTPPAGRAVPQSRWPPGLRLWTTLCTNVRNGPPGWGPLCIIGEAASRWAGETRGTAAGPTSAVCVTTAAGYKYNH